MKQTTVTIERSEHHHPSVVPRGAVRLVEYELARRGIHGHYILQWGPRIKGTPHTPRFAVVGLTDRNNVELEIKPGGNDTAHTCWLSAGQRTESNAAEPPTMEELLIALQMQPQGGEMMSNHGFTDEHTNIKGTLRVLGALGGYDVLIGPFKEQLGEVYPQISTRGWGAVLAAMERRGYVKLQKTPHDAIYSVSLAPAGAKQLNGHAPPPPVLADMGRPATEVGLPLGPCSQAAGQILPGSTLDGMLEATAVLEASTVLRGASVEDAFRERMRRIIEEEDTLLAELLEAEDQERAAVERAKNLRQRIQLASQRAAAARVLLEER